MPLKKSQQSLKNWTKQKWRTKSGKKSSETGERYLPEAGTKNKRKATASGKQRAKYTKAERAAFLRATRKK